MPGRIEAEQFLVAQPPISKGPAALLCQLQRYDPGNTTRLYTPAYDLRRASHVLDPQEAIVTSYEEEKLAVFKSHKTTAATGLVRKVSNRAASVAATGRVRRNSVSTSRDAASHQHTQQQRLSVQNLNALVSQIQCEQHPAGTLRIYYKADGLARDWLVAQSSQGFTFSTVLPPAAKVNFQLVWTHRLRPQRKASNASVISQGHRSLASRSVSPAAATAASPFNTRRRSSLAGLVLTPADEWICRIVDPDKASSGGSRGVKIAKLTADELILYQLTTRTATTSTEASTASLANDGSAPSASGTASSCTAHPPNHITRTVILSALWILTHPHDLFLLHGLGTSTEWLRRPSNQLRGVSPDTQPRSRSPRHRQSSQAQMQVTTPTPISNSDAILPTTHPSGDTRIDSSDSVGRAPSPRTPSTLLPAGVGARRSSLSPQSRHSFNARRSQAQSVGKTYSSASTIMTVHEPVTTLRPTCLSFLNSFKLWKPRSQRQRR